MQRRSPKTHQRNGLVLAGGGMRGAYEVGVLSGVVSILGLRAADRSPFSIFTGTSVGAINVSRLAAYADRGDLDVDGLVDVWSQLRLSEYLKLNLRGIARLLAQQLFSKIGGEQALLDVAAIERIVRQEIDWVRLRRNIDADVVHALVIAALEIGSGQSVMFADLAPGADFSPSRDPRRRGDEGAISADHVLASAAIPFVFAPRAIDGALYCDGGLRFNTPIAPAIRCGADRLLVVAPLLRGDAPASTTRAQASSPAFFIGKILNALLLDPLVYDLQVLQRFNRLIETLETTLDPHEIEKLDKVMVETRGLPYRKLETLVFMPTEDIGRLASTIVREKRARGAISHLARFLVTGGAINEDEADLASYFLFDGEFASALIELGKKNALARREEVLRFFDPAA